MLSAVRKRARLAHEAGFGLIELLAAMSVMSIGILAVFVMLNSGMITIQRAAKITTAAALADSKMERFRALTFDRLGLDDSVVDGVASSPYKTDAAFKDDLPTTTLTAAIDTAATTVTVATAAGFPTANQFRIQVDSEVMLVTAGAGALTWTVTRAKDGTTAAAHADGATVKHKQRAHVPACGTGVCTTAVPTEVVAGADGRDYRVDTYVSWKQVASQSGIGGRALKLITIVVRDPADLSRVFARVSSSFDEATGCSFDPNSSFPCP